MNDALHQALSWPITKRSLLITAVVGTILNIINQGDVLIAGGNVSWLKVALTFCLPYCVATYGAFCACREGTRE